MPDQPASTLCEGCGATDTDPKWHYGIETYHHDCAPFRVIRDVTTTGHWDTRDPGMPRWVDGEEIPPDDLPQAIKRALDIRRLAQDGIRGPRLHERIRKLNV